MFSSVFKHITDFYESAIFIYCVGLFLFYILLAVLSLIAIRRSMWKNKVRAQQMLVASPLTPGISVIAPAYNEGVTIIPNVRSLLALNYPRFEVVIVNDGSKDDTLEQLIHEFELTEVDFFYRQQVPSQEVKRFFKSTNPAYSRLLVLDKVNGKSKADAVNAGINAASFDFFLNTDVDCILNRDTLLRLVKPFMDDPVRVIATGAPLRAANSCEVEAGVITKVRVPKSLLPRFQEMEYIRSYLLGKMGWTFMNAVPNVSGGLGLFDKDIVIRSGGYDPASFGEDMDMVVRMCMYMCEQKLPYRIHYIPETLCWTEVPATLKVFSRQRIRWARGLFQIFFKHRKALFNPTYRKLGLIMFPYNFFFELLAPLIEFAGILYYIYIVVNHLINWDYAIILLVFIYTFSILITSLSILWDQLIFRYYSSWKEVFQLCLLSLAEPFVYHPVVLFCAIRGYFNQLIGKKHSWGNMQRQGFVQAATSPEKK
ncbi:glycosyltransferase family 2 protein [Chitinophaga nivalis]|uniref:Glycosyltransferase n=1 Tax=Chitinophaga nivalis TaxID=2991709 RepID=A0ABT3IQ86_9BACT|nr:glycosyltransferase [Chitinophaga nivalis]MCW3464186.1 glycosyltransferase [Chitinophaga nivalis]MCW3486124.1 glycosyltransferase [Chitinophaga nivalis]